MLQIEDCLPFRIGLVTSSQKVTDITFMLGDKGLKCFKLLLDKRRLFLFILFLAGDLFGLFVVEVFVGLLLGLRVETGR